MSTGAPTTSAISAGDMPFELVEDEDDALLLGEPPEQTLERAHPLAALDVLVGERLARRRRRARRAASSVSTGRLRAERRCISTTLTVTRWSQVENFD